MNWYLIFYFLAPDQAPPGQYQAGIFLRNLKESLFYCWQIFQKGRYRDSHQIGPGRNSISGHIPDT